MLDNVYLFWSQVNNAETAMYFIGDLAKEAQHVTSAILLVTRHSPDAVWKFSSQKGGIESQQNNSDIRDPDKAYWEMVFWYHRRDQGGWEWKSRPIW